MRAKAATAGVSVFSRPSHSHFEPLSAARVLRAAASTALTAGSAVVAVGVIGVVATVGAAFVLNTVLARDPHIQARAFGGPGALAVAEQRMPAAIAGGTFDSKWAMQLSRARFLLSEFTTYHGLTLVSVPANIRSLARE